MNQKLSVAKYYLEKKNRNVNRHADGVNNIALRVFPRTRGMRIAYKTRRVTKMSSCPIRICRPTTKQTRRQVKTTKILI